jgi:viroplasmin and RNaseH domain-containing protein
MKNSHYIAGYLKGNEIGVIDFTGKFNNSDKLDFDSRMFFDSVEEAQSFLDKLSGEENHPDFNYQIEEVEDYD